MGQRVGWPAAERPRAPGSLALASGARDRFDAVHPGPFSLERTDPGMALPRLPRSLTTRTIGTWPTTRAPRPLPRPAPGAPAPNEPNLEPGVGGWAWGSTALGARRPRNEPKFSGRGARGAWAGRACPEPSGGVPRASLTSSIS